MFVFDRHPSQYRHWKLTFDGPVATLSMDVDESGGLVEGYALKLNSYDLGVDMEFADALQRIRFEHPEVRAVVITSAKERLFCAGANIYMLGQSSHAWKVNFCKFTNETRNGIEDSSRHSGLKFLAALNGACAGGGYEMALACDEILMVDDRSSTVSLPEVPLLGVLPGTGGLTRLVDKRRVRRDLADLFCANPDGVRADRAKAWRLVDAIASRRDFPERTRARALELAQLSDRPEKAKGIELTPLNRRIENEDRIVYDWVEVEIDRDRRLATLTVKAPMVPPESAIAAIEGAGARWWPLAMARDLDDAILMLRLNALDIGLWVLKTRGNADHVVAADQALTAHASHWFVRETIGMLRRTFARLDVSSRSLYAVVDDESCFAGSLAELLLASDRSYMIDRSASGEDGPTVRLSAANFGICPTVSGRTRLALRFNNDATAEALRVRIGESLDTPAALAAGLVTLTPDDLDWDEELRLALDERAGLSPDALTGMEASLRFAGAETMETKIFGRLSAWQNWIFNRPNAVGEKGALKLFGSGSKAQFDWQRV
ncbi:MAG: benzoyl-CoA-dihydrodiol lyase [Alphaproteobacteria bacterium]|nr:benzoyl-CoA-dihydrodiol lyase [Alphaproteobacteria bacterium]